MTQQQTKPLCWSSVVSIFRQLRPWQVPVGHAVEKWLLRASAEHLPPFWPVVSGFNPKRMTGSLQEMLHRFYISLSPTPSGVLDMQPGHVLCGFLSSFLFMTQIIDKIITVHALCLGGVDFCHCLSFPLPLSVYKCVYGSFSFPPQRLKPNQTDDAKLLHFTEVRFSSRVHIVNIVINKLLLGMYIFLNCSPIIMSLTFSSGNLKKKKFSLPSWAFSLSTLFVPCFVSEKTQNSACLQPSLWQPRRQSLVKDKTFRKIQL